MPQDALPLREALPLGEAYGKRLTGIIWAREKRQRVLCWDTDAYSLLGVKPDDYACRACLEEQPLFRGDFVVDLLRQEGLIPGLAIDAAPPPL